MSDGIVYSHSFEFELSHGEEKKKIRGEVLLTGEGDPIVKLVPITDGLDVNSMKTMLQIIELWNELNRLNGDVTKCELRKK